MALDPPTTNQLVAGVLLLLGAYAAALSAALGRRSLRSGQSLELVRAIRLLTLALAAGLGALALLTGRSGFAVIGALILAEELYETGVLALIIRRGEARPAAGGDHD